MALDTKVDQDVIGVYADTFCWLRRCRDFIETHGESFPKYDEAGNLTGYGQYPQVSLAVKLTSQLIQLEEQLGLSPSGRSRLSVQATNAAPSLPTRGRPTTLPFQRKA